MAQDPNAVSEVPQNIKDLMSNYSFTDIDDNPLKVSSIRYLEEDRKKIYGGNKNFESILTADHVLSVECVPKDEADDIKNEDKEISEKIMIITGDDIEELEIEDMITMEDMDLSQAIEFTFYENGPWFLGGIGQDSLAHYRGSKFPIWKKQLLNPVCEASFKRLLCIGLVTNIFDRYCFPMPEEEKKDYTVVDDHGNNVELPRPVKALRIWNVKKRAYDVVSARLEGDDAPKVGQEGKYWENMLEEFRQTRGIEYIDGLLASFKAK
mmetsp:Transcript_50009/g.44818  ORF Transcript_50009/g.44818 Transcript_50009/m.44818 type:complete len:266 (-) Transcript_50009:103-900(-)